jgi:fructosamine-3-kinase
MLNSGVKAILQTLGRGDPRTLTPVGGGCIADARLAEFGDGTRVFVKSRAAEPEMFEREAEGLQALASAGAIRVPAVLAVSSEALVLEYIPEGGKQTGFYQNFGREFAQLHRSHGPACGFAHDNFIGLTPQRNTPLSGDWDALTPGSAGDGGDWPGFFLERRLRYQAERAERQGHGAELRHLLDRSAAVILEMLNEAIEPPSLLHGDLWGGNYLADESGRACLIDPAVYFGHREADLAMTRLFGGFSPAFYQAYEEAFPLQGGHEKRLSLYQLYHLLNHLNLFGRSYYGQCERILRRFSD